MNVCMGWYNGEIGGNEKVNEKFHALLIVIKMRYHNGENCDSTLVNDFDSTYLFLGQKMDINNASVFQIEALWVLFGFTARGLILYSPDEDREGQRLSTPPAPP